MMPRTIRTRLRAVPASAAVAATIALLAAGCGTANPASLTGGSAAAGRPATAAGTHRQPGSPAPGTRGQSLRLAGSLLARQLLPRGTRRSSTRSLPASLKGPGLTGYVSPSVDVRKVYRVPLSPGAAAAFFADHRPGNTTGYSNGSGGDGTVTADTVGEWLSSLPAGIESASLFFMIVPDPAGGSLVRADASVAWYPPRSAAEYISPDGFHVVSISADLLNPEQHVVTRTFTSRQVIDQLAVLLNDSPAAVSQITPGCPAMDVLYTVTFTAKAGQQQDIVAKPGCLGVAITVGGRPQPALATIGNRLSYALFHLLGLQTKVLMPRPGASPCGPPVSLARQRAMCPVGPQPGSQRAVS